MTAPAPPTPSADAAAGLQALQVRLAHELDCLQLPVPRWPFAG